jgi:nitroreductase
MNAVIQNIMTRRSVRSFKKNQITDTDLNIILQAAQYAPSGSNSQCWLFTVLQNEEILKKINGLVREAFSNLKVDENTYRSKKAGKNAALNDDYSFYYNAPTLIIVSNEREYCNAMADSSAALQNILLTAHSLGVSSCWINQLTWFCDEIKLRALLSQIGIPENHIVCGAAALGYNNLNELKPQARRDGRVNIVK